jgi:hypothetical protein
MELSTGQQRLLFAVVVLLLAGLGIYLLGPISHHGAAAAPTATPSASGPGAAATSTTPAAVQPTTSPVTSPAPSATGNVDIYQWLPFSEQDLAQAAQTTIAFAADYDTFSYTETAAAYGEKMAGLVTTELGATLQNDYATPGVATPRSAQKQVSTGSGTIASIRAFGAGSITFLVNITQQLSTTKGTSTTSQQYAVTVIYATTDGWQVNDIELANAGNS